MNKGAESEDPSALGTSPAIKVSRPDTHTSSKGEFLLVKKS